MTDPMTRAELPLLYLAPMEGVTGYIARNAFHNTFGGFDRYFTPFIPEGKGVHKKTVRDLAPENNPGIELIPQSLGNHSAETLMLFSRLQKLGFSEVNINLGCPSGTVAPKGRGSGFLAYPDELEQFLDDIYREATCKVSIKTRVGYEDTSNWDRIMDIYHKYPQMSELIIHPRTRKDMYQGPVRMQHFEELLDRFSDSPVPICYNGDIRSRADYRRLSDKYPQINRFMIGRGAFAKPGLAAAIAAEVRAASGPAERQLASTPAPADVLASSTPAPADVLASSTSVPADVLASSTSVPADVLTSSSLAAADVPSASTFALMKASSLRQSAFGPWTEAEYRQKLRFFHDDIMNTYEALYHAPKDTLFRMKEIWFYLNESFIDCEKPLKKIRKCQDLMEYRMLVDHIFSELELTEL